MGFRGSRVQIPPSRSVEVSARPLVIGAWHCRFVAEFPGAFLKDPARLFNSSLDGNVRRAIDIHEGEEVDESAFKALVRQAVALNSSGKSKPSKKAKS